MTFRCQKGTSEDSTIAHFKTGLKTNQKVSRLAMSQRQDQPHTSEMVKKIFWPTSLSAA